MLFPGSQYLKFDDEFGVLEAIECGAPLELISAIKGKCPLGNGTELAKF
jgi:hypothetical protein